MDYIILTTIIGLAMIYAWIHFAVVVFKNIKRYSKYEKVIVWFSVITLTLCVIGMMSS